MKELKITDERVREAAKTCGTAKTVLESLFPEAFGKEWKLLDYDQIILKTDGHFDGFDIHFYDKEMSVDSAIGYITFDRGNVTFCKTDSNYKVEIETGKMSDQAILFHVYKKVS